MHALPTGLVAIKQIVVIIGKTTKKVEICVKKCFVSGWSSFLREDGEIWGGLYRGLQNSHQSHHVNRVVNVIVVSKIICVIRVSVVNKDIHLIIVNKVITSNTVIQAYILPTMYVHSYRSEQQTVGLSQRWSSDQKPIFTLLANSCTSTPLQVMTRHVQSVNSIYRAIGNYHCSYFWLLYW